MDRRNLVLGGGALALLGGRALAQQPGTATTVRRTPTGTVTQANLGDRLAILCRTRPNINSLTAAQLTALKTGIAAMKARPVSDPTSWPHQAGIHGSNLSPQRAQWGTCEHGTLHFLSWHRLYLYYFERILRAASGSPSLTLPFWNWTADRAIPVAFRSPAGGNPLYVSQRSSGINDGALIPASAVSPTAALAETGYNGFTGSIEGSPHGSVHVSVGGWMSSFNTAGQDPLFWLHHCNIDRLWETWLNQGGGRANPTNAAWRDRTFSFFDETGTQRTVPASRALGTCRSLQYEYPRRRLIMTSQILATQISPQVAQQIRAPSVVAGPSVTLGAVAAEATVGIPVRTGAVAGAGKTYLAFERIAVTNPEGFYEIYLNPPPGKTNLDFTDPSYAGNLVLFGLTPADHATMQNHAGMGDEAPRRVFDISRKVAQLRGTRGFDPAKLRVVLVLRTPEGAGVRKPAVNVPRATVGSIQVISQ